MNWGLWGVALLAGIYSARIGTLYWRAGIEVDRSTLRLLLNWLAFIGTVSLIVWGFIHIPWYLVIVFFVAASFVVGLTLNTQGRLITFGWAKGGIDIGVTISTLILWFVRF